MSGPRSQLWVVWLGVTRVWCDEQRVKKTTECHFRFFSARKVQQEFHLGDRKSWVEIHMLVPNVQEELAKKCSSGTDRGGGFGYALSKQKDKELLIAEVNRSAIANLWSL